MGDRRLADVLDSECRQLVSVGWLVSISFKKPSKNLEGYAARTTSQAK